MRHSFWNRKIPSLLGFLIIILGIFVTTFLVKGGSIFQSRAGPGNEPKNVQVTNISDTSFTVSFMTDESVIGTLSFGKDPNLLDQRVLDDRDQVAQSVNKYQAHSISLNSLEPDTTYYYTITSGTDTFSNNDSPFTVKTGPVIIDTPTSENPMSGKVINPDSSTPNDGLVLVTVNDAEKLSTYLKNDGSYTLPLNNMRNADLTAYFQFNAETIINIEVKSANLASFISVSSDQLSPVPVITLSNNYDFSSPDPESSPSGDLKNENDEKFPVIESEVKTPEVAILSPDTGEDFTDDQPKFDGKALPNEEVEIEIHSDENIKAQVVADGNGKWSFRPAKALSVGEHTITITTKATNGALKKVTEKFTILAAGSQVNASATPSAALSPTKTPTPTKAPTATPAKLATKTPTKTPSPTRTPTTIPTAGPEISPMPTLPPTGAPFAIIAGIGVLAAAATGVALFLLMHKENPL